MWIFCLNLQPNRFKIYKLRNTIKYFLCNEKVFDYRSNGSFSWVLSYQLYS